jgi:hypothetical protein
VQKVTPVSQATVLELGGQVSGVSGEWFRDAARQILGPCSVCQSLARGRISEKWRRGTPYYAVGFSVWLPLQTSTLYGTQ